MDHMIENNRLIIRFGFWRTIAALKNKIIIPLDQISSLTHELPAATWKQIRIPGTFFPGVIKAGSYRIQRGNGWEREFWYVTQPKTSEVVHLEMKDGYPYRRIVLDNLAPSFWQSVEAIKKIQ